MGCSGHSSGLEPQEEDHGSSLACLSSTGLAGACIQGGTEINWGGVCWARVWLKSPLVDLHPPLRLTWNRAAGSTHSDEEGALGGEDISCGPAGVGAVVPEGPCL